MKKIKKKITEKKGITLVALVITIIILLILAGVAISSLSENGLFDKVNIAKEKNEIEKNIEEIKLKIMELDIDKKGKLNLDDLIKNLANEDKYIISLEHDMSKTYQEYDDEDFNGIDEVYILYNEYQYVIYSDLTVKYIDKFNYLEKEKSYKFIEQYQLPHMTGNQTTIEGEGTYYCSSSATLNSDTPAWGAFDGLTSRCWHSKSNAAGSWVQIRLPYMFQLKELIYKNRKSIDWNLGEFEVYASMEGQDWILIGSYKNTNNNSEQGTTFEIEYDYGITGFFYYKFLPKTAIGGSSYVAIGEMSMLGNKYTNSDAFAAMVDSIKIPITYETYDELVKIEKYYDELAQEDKDKVDTYYYNLLNKYKGKLINTAISEFNEGTLQDFLTINEIYDICKNASDNLKKKIPLVGEFIDDYESKYEKLFLNYSTKSTSGVIISTSTNLDSPRTGEKIFDNSLDGGTGCWHSSSRPPQWIKFTFPKNVILNNFTITNRTDNSVNYAIKDFILQGSNDNSTWVEIKKYTNPNKTGGVKSQYDTGEFKYTNKEGYKYYRIYITSGYDTSYVTIGEMTMDITIIK